MVDAGEDIVDGGADDFGVVLGEGVSLGKAGGAQMVRMHVYMYLRLLHLFRRE